MRGRSRWSGETFDGFLNDIRGQHVTAEHAHAALEAAEGGAVEEGSVGGGTGMICHEFKGGIGTASRRVGGLRRRRPRPGELRPARAFPSRRRSGRPADRRPDPATAGRRRVGLDHRHRRDRCAAPAAPVRPAGATRGLRCRPDGRNGRSFERGHLLRLRDRQPRARRRGRASRSHALRLPRSRRSTTR